MSTNKTRKASRPNRRDFERYEAFAHAYLAVGQPTYLNAEKSAEATGYGRGYCRAKAYQLLGRVGVQEAMHRIRTERAKLSTIASPEEVLEVLTTQMRCLPNKLYAEDGSLVPGHKMTDEQAQAVTNIREKTRTIATGEDVITEKTLEYKLVDRQKAAEIIGRHHGIFEKDNEQNKPDLAPIKLVAMPSGPMSLEEWTRQAQAILNGGKTEQLQKMQQLENKVAG